MVEFIAKARCSKMAVDSQSVDRFGNSNQSRAYFPTTPSRPAYPRTAHLYIVETVHAVSAFPFVRQMDHNLQLSFSPRACTRLHGVIGYYSDARFPPSLISFSGFSRQMLYERADDPARKQLPGTTHRYSYDGVCYSPLSS